MIGRPVASATVAAEPLEVSYRPGLLVRSFYSRRLVAGAALIVVVVALALLAPLVAPFSPTRQVPQFGLRPLLWIEPGAAMHVFGTDSLGRDVLARILYGSRVSLLIGVTAVLLAGTVGVSFGLVAGYFGGVVETLLMGLTDALLAIPFVLLAIVAVSLFGQSLGGLIVILGLTGWLGYARIVRGTVLTLKELPYVESARALGSSSWRILLRHILPGVWAPVIVIATQQVGAMMIAESSLSFLGVGVPPTIPTWGTMIADGRSYVGTGWWISTLPGLALTVTVLAVYFFGDGLRDTLDPKLDT
jgi:peptide/nickel transport system permease protein